MSQDDAPEQSMTPTESALWALEQAEKICDEWGYAGVPAARIRAYAASIRSGEVEVPNNAEGEQVSPTSLGSTSADNAPPASPAAPSDTPKTDAVLFGPVLGTHGHEWVYAAHARQLERELSALRAKQSSEARAMPEFTTQELVDALAEGELLPTDKWISAPSMLAASPQQSSEAAQSASVVIPKDPPIELLVSMALRVNHGFGLDDARSQEVQISDMRKVYEEVSGHGFYSEEVKGRYTALLRVDRTSK